LERFGTREKEVLAMSQQDTVRERVEELTWALVDDQIEQGEFELLENLLLSDDGARRTYLDCVQLHADLVGHFAEEKSPGAGNKSPILSFLGGANPSVDVQPSA
jgi:hypothetical protein